MSATQYYSLATLFNYLIEVFVPRKILSLSQTNAHKFKQDQLFDAYSSELYFSSIIHDSLLTVTTYFLSSEATTKALLCILTF